MKKDKIVAILIFGLCVNWIYHHLSLYYYYHYTDLLFAFRLQDWVIFSEVFLALINIYKSIKLFWSKITIKKALLYFGVSVLIGILIKINYWMF